MDHRSNNIPCFKFFTLKIGDIIFTGTPSGVGKVNINDELVGKLKMKNFLNLKLNNDS